jgi:hypothetical protein
MIRQNPFVFRKHRLKQLVPYARLEEMFADQMEYRVSKILVIILAIRSSQSLVIS